MLSNYLGVYPPQLVRQGVEPGRSRVGEERSATSPRLAPPRWLSDAAPVQRGGAPGDSWEIGQSYHGDYSVPRLLG